MNLLRTPAIRDLVQNDLGDLDPRAANPGDALAVEFNLRGEDDGHGCSPGSSIRYEPAGAVLLALAVEADCPPKTPQGLPTRRPPAACSVDGASRRECFAGRFSQSHSPRSTV